MVKLANRLSAIAVSKLSKPGYHADGAGLYLQVSPSGSKSWVFRYRFGDKQREMGLGSLNALSLAQARESAAACRNGLAKEVRIDPLEARQKARNAADAQRAKQRTIPTFDAAARLYIAAHRHEWKNAKHAGQWQSTLDTYVSPVFGSMPVNQIDTALVLKALSNIWTEKTETATRVRGRIESVLDWARVAGHRAGENPARWRGHLEHSLAAPTKAKKVTHHPALPWQKMGALMVDLRSQTGVAAKALEFAILTAARSGEVRMATWGEVDLQSQTWTIPANRMKAGVEHRVPLADAVVELLRQMPRIEGCDLVFPGMKNKPLSDMSLTAVLRRMKRDDITVHGMRSTFRDWCAESSANSFGREAAEHALAHSLPDKVEAAYRRGDQFERRIGLMQAWSDFCATTSATTATVTPIRGAMQSAA
jgi:integrase